MPAVRFRALWVAATASAAGAAAGAGAFAVSAVAVAPAAVAAAAVGLAVAAAANAAVAAADTAVAAVAATSVLHDWRELVRWNLRLVLLLRRLLPVRRLRLRQRVGPERRKILLQEPYR